MLRLITGRAGSGKTGRIIEEITAGGAARPEKRILIVPEQYSHQAERELCGAGGDSLSLYAEVFSFSGLCRRIFSEAGGAAAKYLHKGGRVLAMHMALEKVKGNLDIYASAAGRPEFLSALLDSVDELKGGGVTPERLIEFRESVDFPEKLEELALIMEAYASVTEMLDPCDRLTRAAEKLGLCDFAAGAEIYIDAFTDFTAQEHEIIRLLLRRSKDMTVVLTCDTLSPEGSALFSVVRETAARLIEYARREGVACEVINHRGNGGRSAELNALERAMIDRTTPPFEGEQRGIGVFEAPNLRAECRHAASEIQRLVRDEGCRYRDIAVCARDVESVRPVLESVFESFGIPLFAGPRSDILAKPALAFVISALDTVSGGFEYENVFRYLKTGLADITREDCDKLENYVLKWNIKGSLWLRDEPWSFNPEGFDAPVTETTAAQLYKLNELREKVRVPLLRLREKLRGNGPADERAGALYDFMLETRLADKIGERSERFRAFGDLKTADEYAQLWEILISALDQFVDILGKSPLSRQEFAALLRLVLCCYDVGSIPVSLDRVTFGEVARIAHGNIKHLFMLGANDSVMPMVTETGGVITDHERDALRELGLELLPSGGDRLMRELYSVYSALAEPKEGLCVSYSTETAQGGELRAAYFVPRILEVFPALEISRDPFDEYFDSLMPAFEAAAGAVSGESFGENALAALQFFEGDGAHSNTLEQVKNAAAAGVGRVTGSAVKGLYGDGYSMSASRIDKFYSCKFSFFMQYGLKARPRRPATFEAPEMGTFVHFVLEGVMQEATAGDGFESFGDDELKAAVKKYVDLYIDRTLNGFKDKTPRFRYLFNRLVKDVNSIAANMIDELRVSEFKPMEFELEFGKDGALPPVALVSEEGVITVSGFVDRVDGWVKDGRLYLRVVDYKTGRKSFDLTEVANGLGLQMLIYLFALGRYGLETFGAEVVPAGVLYVPARDVVVQGARGMSEAERRKKAAYELRRSGIILDDEEVVRAMESGADGEMRFLPVKIGKDGKISGQSLVSAERLGKLSRHVDRLLLDIVHELGAGVIDTDPYIKNGRSPCDWCDYAAACGFEKGGAARELKSMNSEEFWRRIGAEET